MLKKNIIIGNFLIFIGSVLFIFFALEFILRVVSPPSIFHSTLPLRPRIRMELDVKLKGVSPKGRFSTNKWGMRGDEPPQDWDNYYTIVTIGGSTTQCFYLDDKKTWPYLLQEKLKAKSSKVWVGNGGLDGATTRSHVIFMKEVIAKIRPNAVIFLIGVNDLGLSLNAGCRLYDFFYEKPTFKSWIFARSRLVQVLYIWKKILFENATIVQKSMHDGFEPKPLRVESTNIQSDFISLLPSLNDFRKNVEEIIQIGESLSTRIVFLTQPMLFEDTEYWRQIEGEFYWLKNKKYILSAAAQWRLLKIFNEELLKICAEEKVEYLDLASKIPHSNLYFYDVTHFTEKGTQLVAEKLSEFLLIDKNNLSYTSKNKGTSK